MKTRRQVNEAAEQSPSRPAYETDYRGMIHCPQCGEEDQRRELHLAWPLCCDAPMVKGCRTSGTGKK